MHKNAEQIEILPAENLILRPKSRLLIASTSLAFSILQSVCTTVMAINGVRLLIGIGSLVMTAGVGATLNGFHEITWLRITFMVGAITGSVLTLGILLRSHRLRNRPAARWRFRPLTPEQRRAETLQIVLSLVTLILVGLEEAIHFHLHHCF